MNVQSLNCQPIRPVYQLNSRPSFGYDEDDEDSEYNELDASLLNNNYRKINAERAEYETMAKNKDSKFLSSVGTLGLGFAAGAASFLTFKTMAPKGVKTLKTIYLKTANLDFVKKAAGYVKKYAYALGDEIKGLYNKIKPESKLGKVKKFCSDKLVGAYTRVKTSIMNFAEKHNIDKPFLKAATNNTGAILVAVPAATTAINTALKEQNEGELE